jgi:hypothetical protein
VAADHLRHRDSDMTSAMERISTALASLGKRRVGLVGGGSHGGIDDDASAASGGGGSASAPGSGNAKRRRLVFRPWDQADFHRR